MKTLVFILSAAAILLFTTCEEDSPMYEDHIEKARTIKIFNLNDNSIEKMWNVYGDLYDHIVLDRNTITYSTYYTDGDYEHGYTYAGKLVVREFVSPFNTYTYYAPAGQYIFSYSAYPEANSIFVSAGDIYLIKDNGNLVSNLTSNEIGDYGSPVFIPSQHLVLYGNSLISENNGGKIFSQNLETGVVDTLVEEKFAYIFPIFITEDKSNLIYTSDDFYNYSIKSVNLDDLQDIKVLTSNIRVTHFGKNKSINDRIVFTSGGTVYVLDLNTADLKAIASSGQFADISIDGEKVVFSTQYDLYLINSDGANQQKLISKASENIYLSLPSFSSDNEQIVFVESNYPFRYH